MMHFFFHLSINVVCTNRYNHLFMIIWSLAVVSDNVASCVNPSPAATEYGVHTESFFYYCSPNQ